MAQLLLSENVPMIVDSDDEDMLAGPDEVNNYKGMYQNEDDEPEQKYFEYGAHFSYELLVEQLEEIRLTLSPSRRGEDKGEKFPAVKNNSAASPPKGIIILIKEQNFRKANNNGKHLANISGEPGSVSNEKTFLFAIGGTNKSRNVNNADKETIYKPGTGVHLGCNGFNALNIYAANNANPHVNMNQSYGNINIPATNTSLNHTANMSNNNPGNASRISNSGTAHNAGITNKLAMSNITRNNNKVNTGAINMSNINSSNVNSNMIKMKNISSAKDTREHSSNITGVNAIFIANSNANANTNASANATNPKAFNAFSSFTNDNSNNPVNLNQSNFLNQSQTNISAKYNSGNNAHSNSNNNTNKMSNAVILIEKKK